MMSKCFKWLSAIFHVRQKDVCELSASMGEYDLHDFPDDIVGEPWHFELLECKHCGKRFYI